jgi:hypothetical protein
VKIDRIMMYSSFLQSVAIRITELSKNQADFSY